MKTTIRALMIISILLFIACIVGLVILFSLPDTNIDDPNDDKPVNNNINDVILSETDDAGQEYIDKLYFVGDSTTLHFSKAGIDKDHLLVPSSHTLMLDTDIDDVTVGYTDLTISEYLKQKGAEIVIITVGVNGADRFTEIRYKTYYKKLITSIKTNSPQTTIILQSVFPVTADYSNQNLGITNAGINRLNQWIKEIALDEGLKYLDTQSILKNENGAQILDYSEEDGVHMNADAYKAILQYIRTHALK